MIGLNKFKSTLSTKVMLLTFSLLPLANSPFVLVLTVWLIPLLHKHNREPFVVESSSITKDKTTPSPQIVFPSSQTRLTRQLEGGMEMPVGGEGYLMEPVLRVGTGAD